MTDDMAGEVASALCPEQALVRSLGTCSKEVVQEGLSHYADTSPRLQPATLLTSRVTPVLRVWHNA